MVLFQVFLRPSVYTICALLEFHANFPLAKYYVVTDQVIIPKVPTHLSRGPELPESDDSRISISTECTLTLMLIVFKLKNGAIEDFSPAKSL